MRQESKKKVQFSVEWVAVISATLLGLFGIIFNIITLRKTDESIQLTYKSIELSKKQFEYQLKKDSLDTNKESFIESFKLDIQVKIAPPLDLKEFDINYDQYLEIFVKNFSSRPIIVENIQVFLLHDGEMIKIDTTSSIYSKVVKPFIKPDFQNSFASIGEFKIQEFKSIKSFWDNPLGMYASKDRKLAYFDKFLPFHLFFIRIDYSDPITKIK